MYQQNSNVMKTVANFLVLVMLLTFSSAMATDPIKKAKKANKASETQIKLLPTNKVGSIKVLYVNKSESAVSVYIAGKNASFTDRVKLSAASKGFIKTYDLTDLEAGPLTIKVTDSQMSVSYDAEKMKDNRIWAKYWNQYLPQPEPVEPIIASLQ